MTTEVTMVKPELEVENVWCPNCGRQKFELRYTTLVCLHCGTSLEWSKVWSEWFGRSSPCLLGFQMNGTPAGTKWESQFDGYQYTMVAQYNPNTGRRLADPRIRRALLKVKSCLEKKLVRVDHQLTKVVE